MDERLSRLEALLEQLTIHVGDLERRLAALETREPAAAAVRPHDRPPGGERDALERLASLRASDFGAVVALVGRTLVVLAGAYLLRALTESGTLTAGPGVLLGLLFALCWVVMADRAGARGRSLSAAFHGVAFLLIACPLLFEATTRFQFLNTAAAAAGLGGSAAVALAVAARRRLPGVAWVTTLGVLATAGTLMLATAELGPLTLLLVLLGVATLWLGHLLDWTVLRWPVALGADLAILILSGRAVAPDVADRPGMALAAQMLLLVAYLGSVAVRTLCLGREATPFEIVQGAAAIAVGLGGAAYVTGRMGGAFPLGIATLALAAGCYAVAVAFVEPRQGRRRNFYFYTSAGLVFALAGCALVLPRPPLGLTYAALGVATAWAGRLWRRRIFRTQGAVYLVAAVAASGLLTHVGYGLGLPLPPAGAPSAAMLGVLALCLGALRGLGPPATEGTPLPAARLPRLVGVVVALGGLMGVALAWLVPVIVGAEAAAHGGQVATLRTALLVVDILALAWAARALEFVEGAWLVYPLLVLTGLKFVFEDFRAGQPATLFVSFALYGLALIVGPRLCRRSR
jgi:hypothetical protein